MKIKQGLKVSTQDFWYDLTDGGYLNPNEICESPSDAFAIQQAIKKLEDFRDSCEEQIEGFIQ